MNCRILIGLFAFCALSCAAMPGTTDANGSTSTGANSSTFSGKVKAYLLSAKGEVEGLILVDGTTVRLPAHHASLLVKAVKPGHAVTVTATTSVPEPTAQGRGVEASTITDEVTHLSVKEEPSPDASASRSEAKGSAHGTAHNGSPAAVPKRVAGKVAQLIHDPQGEIDGALLGDGSQVRFDTGLGRALKAKHGENPTGTLTATGKGVKTEQGVVVDAERLTYNGFPISKPSPAR